MRFNVLVKDVMSKKLRSVRLNDSIEKAANIMKKYKVGSVLVVDKKAVKGIITTMDIVYKYVAGKRGKKAKDIMTRDPVCISPRATIEEAAKLMVEKKIEKLPVFDKGRLVGVVTNNDILKIEPALFEILLERMKIGARISRSSDLQFAECEVCGNYADDIEEVNGVYMCSECRP